MMSSWRECKLGDVADIIMGQSPTGDTCNANGSGTPLLNGPTEFGIRFPKAVQFTTSPKKISNIDDILFCVRGSTTGRMNWSNQHYALGRGLASIRHKQGHNYRYFIKALLDFNLPVILASATGSTFPNVSREQLENLEISLPPLNEQKAIAEVLSSLDDKIDLLHRQNQTLEDLAQTLFRQWFIEEAKEEWEEKPLRLFGDIICGKTPSKSNALYFDGNVPFIKIPDMHGNTFIFKTTDTLSETGKESQKNKTLPPKSICVSCIATVGLVSMNIIESQTNQQINSIIPKKDFYRYFLYLFMKSSYDFLHTMASGGTATLNLNTGDFSKIAVLKPSDEILKSFHEIVEPIFDKIFGNQQQIQTLENIRDTLLPKLLSGELVVSE